jgi:hypothetical protein
MLNWEEEIQQQLPWDSLSPEQAMFGSGKSRFPKYLVPLQVGK